VRLAVVEVGDVHRPAAASADLDRLAERIEVPITERVAHVGVVEAAAARSLGRQCRELVRRRERARWIVEPAGDAERTCRHRVGEDRAHVGERGRVRRHVVPTQP